MYMVRTHFQGLALALSVVLSACAANQPQQEQASNDAPIASTQEDEAGQMDKLAAAQGLLHEHKADSALRLINEVTGYYDAKYGKSDKRIYSARTLTESLLYAGSAAKDGAQAQVLTGTWAMACELQGYTLADLGDPGGARRSLEHARQLAPYNSVVLSELAYSYQLDKDFEQSLKIYVEAETGSVFSPEGQKNIELTRALRGEGYDLTEMGQLDEAEAKYKKCLEINPNDTAAQHELEYIAHMRSSSN